MKRHILFTIFLMFITVYTSNSQVNKECNIKYSLMKGNIKEKKYAEAKEQINYLLENCPKLTVNIYKYGTAVAKKTNDNDLVTKLYNKRLIYFPEKDVAKAHSDYASFLIKNKLATNDQIFKILLKAYEKSPKDMSSKNIFRFFQCIVDEYKNSDIQKVFDTYDNVMESVREKLDFYNKEISPLLAKKNSGNIDSKESKKLKIYIINSKAAGQVEGGLDVMIKSISTCDRLIPILSKDFDSKKTDGKWLRRAVSRLYNKGCQSDPLYAKIAKAYADALPSADSYNFLAGVLQKNGDTNGASMMRKKAFNLETDPNKKAKLKLIEAYDAGKGSKARSLALQALKFNPNFGKAYLFIANLYARSANSCGKDEFEKRMVYVAALDKAIKAQRVDPGCGAGKFIRNYKKHLPSKKLVFVKAITPGSNYKIGCWIGETVRVPKQ